MLQVSAERSWRSASRGESVKPHPGEPRSRLSSQVEAPALDVGGQKQEGGTSPAALDRFLLENTLGAKLDKAHLRISDELTSLRLYPPRW